MDADLALLAGGGLILGQALAQIVGDDAHGGVRIGVVVRRPAEHLYANAALFKLVQCSFERFFDDKSQTFSRTPCSAEEWTLQNASQFTPDGLLLGCVERRMWPLNYWMVVRSLWHRLDYIRRRHELTLHSPRI